MNVLMNESKSEGRTERMNDGMRERGHEWRNEGKRQ